MPCTNKTLQEWPIGCHTKSITPVQVYRLEGGSKVLLVRPGYSNWTIRDSVEADIPYFWSASAPLCPADRKASTSERLGWTCWQYYTPETESKWADGDITLTCPVHT